MIAALALSAALAACPADTPAAMRLEGVPSVLVSGRPYTAALLPTGSGTAVPGGWTLGVHDRGGRGWSAQLPALEFRQAFSVGLTGAPYAVTGTYAETLGDGSCTRTLSVAAAVERRVLGLTSCRRAAVAPRTLLLACGGRRLRGLRWRGWHDDVAVGRAAAGERVRLSRPEECASVGGFLYTRARVDGRPYVIDCPIESF